MTPEIFVAKVKRLYPEDKYLHQLVQEGEWRAIGLMHLMTKKELMSKILAAGEGNARSAGEDNARKIILDELERVALVHDWKELMKS